jgi:putative transposase
MTTREIAEHVGELYGTEISPDLVSAVTDAVLEEVAAWQSRGLDSTYAIIFFDAIRVKIRNEGLVSNRAVYLALGIRCSGHKEILGIWIEQTEGAKFWLRVMTELRSRGVQDILIAVVDGLKGFPEAITSVFPQTVVQTCIVHLIRFSMHFARWKERRLIGAALKPIYQAESAAVVQMRLEEFDRGPWGRKYPAIAQSWRRNWEQVIPFFAFAPEVRTILYTIGGDLLGVRRRSSEPAGAVCREHGRTVSAAGNPPQVQLDRFHLFPAASEGDWARSLTVDRGRDIYGTVSAASI